MLHAGFQDCDKPGRMYPGGFPGVQAFDVAHPASLETGTSRVSLHRDIRPEHRLPVLRACELPSRRRHRHLAHRTRHRPRMRFLPRSIRRHSQNPHLQRSIVPARLPIALQTAPLILEMQTLPHPTGSCSESVERAHSGPSPCLVSCEAASLLPPLSRMASSSPTSSSARPFF